MNDIINEIRKDLIAHADARIRDSSFHFFKEPVKPYGVRTATVTLIAKEHFARLKGIPKSEIFKLCDLLWQSGYLEETFIACQYSHAVRKQYEPADFVILEKWISAYVNNWASCDTLCNHTVGDFIVMYPEFLAKLKEFTYSDNRWMRRAASVSLIVPARKGKFLTDIFEIADLLLTDPDDLVQKGYGWMLKAASQAHQQEVYQYVLSKKAIMPRTALRYAIEKMPPEMRSEAMKK